MSTVWEVPVASPAERALGVPRRMLRPRGAVALPRDARPPRSRRERLPEALRLSGASSVARSPR